MKGICVICGKEFEKVRNSASEILCSNPECKKQRRRDREKQYRLNHKDIVKPYKYGGNRNKAWERDNYTCQLCGSKENIVCHHIDGSGNTDHPNNNLDNLITLCSACHSSLHHKGAEYKPKLIITCETCGKKFASERRTTRIPKYCSKECANIGIAKKNTENNTVICPQCGKKFTQIYREKEGLYNTKYCSRECFINSRTKKVKTTCAICGKKFMAYAYKLKRGYGKYCSKECQYKGMALKFKK